ncbi:MAG: helix-turn-helix domain-containing protein [Spirochaetia bacterium]
MLFRLSVTGTAEVLDCSREALSRALSELENTGAVRREGHMIIIEDEPALHTVHKHPPYRRSGPA